MHSWPRQLRFIASPLWLFIFCITVLPGCYKQRVEVHLDKDRTRPMGTERIDASLQPPEKGPVGEPEETRMVVTIHNREKEMWFFRVTGPKQDIDQTESGWRPFVDGIEFGDNEEPLMELPEGWQTGRSSQFRYATVITNLKPPIEIIVSRLPQGQNLISNINRWRGQLSLDPISERPEDHVKPRYEGDDSILVYDEVGQSSGGGMVPPFANRRPAEPSEKIAYSIPPDWTKLSESVAISKYEKKEDGSSIEISVTKLPGSAIQWPSVVRMWSGQLKLPEPDEEKIESISESLTVDSATAKKVLLESEETNKSIIGIMIDKGATSWFVKMSGDTSLVESEAEKFSKMVESIEFE